MAIMEMNPIFYQIDKLMLNYIMQTWVQNSTCNHLVFIIAVIVYQEQID